MSLVDLIFANFAVSNIMSENVFLAFWSIVDILYAPIVFQNYIIKTEYVVPFAENLSSS